jgi:hypothetical protein
LPDQSIAGSGKFGYPAFHIYNMKDTRIWHASQEKRKNEWHWASACVPLVFNKSEP